MDVSLLRWRFLVNDKAFIASLNDLAFPQWWYTASCWLVFWLFLLDSSDISQV